MGRKLFGVDMVEITQELFDALGTKGYSGVPHVFKYVLQSGETFTRDTRLTQQSVDEAFVPQILTVIDTIERAPLPTNIQKFSQAGTQDITVVVERAWAEDDSGNVVKTFDPTTIKIADDEWPVS